MESTESFLIQSVSSRNSARTKQDDADDAN